jgi:hypothetical protein
MKFFKKLYLFLFMKWAQKLSLMEKKFLMLKKLCQTQKMQPARSEKENLTQDTQDQKCKRMQMNCNEMTFKIQVLLQK